MQEGNLVLVTSGPHAGRRGRIVLTVDGNHKTAAQLLGLRPGWVKVALDGAKREDIRFQTNELEVELATPATRLERDDELRARVLMVVSDAHRDELDQVAGRLGMERARMPA